MRMWWCRVAIAVVLSFGAHAPVRAQDTTSTANLRVTDSAHIAQLVLKDGSMIVGRVLAVTPTTIRFASSFGETSIARSAIASARVSTTASLHGGEFWPEDPSRTRLFFAPTGRMLREGEIYFSDPYVFFPNLQGGVTDQLSIGAGMSIFPGIGLDEQLYYITPKVGVYSSATVNVAVGALFAGLKDISDQSPFGIGYGVATFGGEDASLTTGAGYGFARGSRSSTALIMVGGMARVSRNAALLTENYFTSTRSTSYGVSGGVRLMSEHIAVDLALATGKDANAVIPYLAFIYKW
jgi:hypothetical protein